MKLYILFGDVFLEEINENNFGELYLFESNCETLCSGENSIFFYGENLITETMLSPIGNIQLNTPIDLKSLAFFDNNRDVQGISLNTGYQHIHGNDSPLLFLTIEEDAISAYRYVDGSQNGQIALKIFKKQFKDLPNDVYQSLKQVCMVSFSKLNFFSAKLNPVDFYAKWKPNIELERKFTFTNIINTWDLIQDLYEEILARKFKPFVLEVGKDFQVFDYESHLYAIQSPEHEKGYISFIPQTNGLVSIKRKWFVQNQEERIEKITQDVAVPIDSFDTYLKTTLELHHTIKMPVFRRKRFDVNFESLKTGNVFGIYFDICRIQDSEGIAFSQCEVEYCRTRSLNQIDTRLLYEEYEAACHYTEHFLRKHNAPYKQNLYSKLDFVSEARDKILIRQ